MSDNDFPVTDTRHADSAYARQIADESGRREIPITFEQWNATPDAMRVCAVTGKTDCQERSCELHYMDAPLRLDPADARMRRTYSEPWDAALRDFRYRVNADLDDSGTADFAAAHDAHMARMYCEPWDALPADPGTGDPLTGTYGRTYAEDGWLLMQATGDLFGPATGHCPILLFSSSVHHQPMGGAKLAHVDTFDGWDAALRDLRSRVNADLDQSARNHPGTCVGCTAAEITAGHREGCPDRAPMTVETVGLLTGGVLTAWHADGRPITPAWADTMDDTNGTDVYPDGACTLGCTDEDCAVTGVCDDCAGDCARRRNGEI